MVFKVVGADPRRTLPGALNSYLAWDRRTRVVHLADTMESVIDYVGACRRSWPDVVRWMQTLLAGRRMIKWRKYNA